MTLIPAMTLRSKVKQIKEVGDGIGVSYGLTYTTKGKTHIASIPVGYGDGYKRGFSNKASVLIKGCRYPVAGRVCMDWLMTDLGAAHDVREGDEVILFGRRGDTAVPLWELAEIAETIPYEILCGISERVPRIYLDSTAVSAGPGKAPEMKRDAFKNK
jgi:alanine racemase